MRLRKLLKGMMEGVATTEKVFLQVLGKQGAHRFDPQGQQFDPNFHSALFEMVDPSKQPGVVGAVTKVRGNVTRVEEKRHSRVGDRQTTWDAWQRP